MQRRKGTQLSETQTTETVTFVAEEKESVRYVLQFPEVLSQRLSESLDLSQDGTHDFQ